MVEVVDKFNKKSTASFRKGKWIAKVPFKLILGHIHVFIHTYIIYIYEHQH